ncbi:MAG: nitroreductase family protein [Bacteroidetes bacterium]|jgi:nitroreductase|nr:nitroreductase family protein [Bacteroidota bacterium]MDA0931687.1 nitroreductase family protein [Bacteroidota bacterium]
MSTYVSSAHAAKTDNLPEGLLPAIRNRWSIRSFSPELPTKAELRTLFEAARWSASSMNAQPWRFEIAFRPEPRFQQFLNALSAGNQAWAQHAPVLGMAYTLTDLPAYNMSNRHAMFDLGAALSSLFIQAADLGIFGHLMGGYDPELAQSLVEEERPHELGCFFVLGYPGMPEQLDEPFLTREWTPRQRLPLEELVKGL